MWFRKYELCVTRIQKKVKHKASSVSIFTICTNYFINIFIWEWASLSDTSQKDPVVCPLCHSQLCETGNAVESTSRPLERKKKN